MIQTQRELEEQFERVLARKVDLKAGKLKLFLAYVCSCLYQILFVVSFPPQVLDHRQRTEERTPGPTSERQILCSRSEAISSRTRGPAEDSRGPQLR